MGVQSANRKSHNIRWETICISNNKILPCVFGHPFFNQKLEAISFHLSTCPLDKTLVNPLV